jgi:hypothetical protein
VSVKTSVDDGDWEGFKNVVVFKRFTGKNILQVL